MTAAPDPLAFVRARLGTPAACAARYNFFLSSTFMIDASEGSDSLAKGDRRSRCRAIFQIRAQSEAAA